MDHVSNRADLDALRAEVHRIESEPSFDFAAAEKTQAAVVYAVVESAPLPEEQPPVVGQFDDLPIAAVEDDEFGPVPFGEWLLKQDKRKDWIADLAKWAKSDIRFPKLGSADDVRKRLTDIAAEGDAFEALDDAELDWLAL